ncbi:uncharacterized protein LOC120332534 [Styela clava]
MNFLKAFCPICLFVSQQIVNVQATQICVTLPDSDDDVQLVDYDRINEGIEDRFAIVMDKWKAEMTEKFGNLGDAIAAEADENFEELENTLVESITNNKTASCEVKPINRDDLPPELCEVRMEGACFYSKINTVSNVSYEQAKAICSDDEAKLAIIPNQEIYDDIVANVREKIEGRSYTNLWLGIKINVMSGDVIYPNPETFTKWSRNFPSIGLDYKKHQHVYLFASSNPGMRNSYPTFNHFGVVCQI